MIKPISFCITTANNEKNYVVGLLDSLIENTKFSKHEVLILIDTDNQNTYSKLLDYKKKYPNIFIYSNLNDTLVPYLEPFNYYLKMKGADVFTSGERDIIMNMKLKYGHSQSSKRYEKLKEMGEIYDIILKYII